MLTLKMELLIKNVLSPNEPKFTGALPFASGTLPEQVSKPPYSKAQKFPIWVEQPKLEISGLHPASQCIFFTKFDRLTIFFAYHSCSWNCLSKKQQREVIFFPSHKKFE